MRNLFITNPTPVFKKWSNKSYAVFSSLGLQVKVGVLAVGMLGAFGVLESPAQSLSSKQDTIDLDDVDVETELPNNLEEAGTNILVIDNSDPLLQPASSISAILDNQPGLDIRSRGAADIQSDISIRGGTFDQNMILLNGINISNPHTGHNTLNLPIDFSTAQSLEIIKGAGASTYGFNGFSGAINIMTSTDTSPLDLTLVGGDFGYAKVNLKSFVPIGSKINNHIALDYSQSNGYRTNTDFQVGRLFYHGLYENNGTKAEWMAGYTNRAFGANSFYTARFPNQFEETSTQIGAIKLQKVLGKFKLYTHGFWLRSNDRFELFRDNPAVWYSNHNYHQTDVAGINLKANYYGKYGKTTALVETREEYILSNVLGEDLNDTVQRNNLIYTPTNTGFFTKDYRRRIVNTTLAHRFQSGNWTLDGSLMGIYINDYKIYPGLDISYQLNSRNTIVGSVNNSVRLPTFTDLFYVSRTQISNRDLRQEKAWTYELSYQYKQKQLQLYSSVFYRQGRDMIDWSRKSSEEIWRSENLSQLFTIGAEISATYQAKNKKAIFQMISLSYTYLDNSGDNLSVISSYAANFLRHKATAATTFRIIERLNLVLGANYQQRQGEYLQYVNLQPTGLERYPSFLIFDSKLSYSFSKVTAFLSVENILDTDYFDFGNVFMPGRWAKGGLRFRL